jgi:two-component system, NarL family, sensor histidine kinase UhpB
LSRARRPEEVVVRASQFEIPRAGGNGQVEQAHRRLNSLVETQSARIADLLHDDVSQVLASAHITLDDVAGDVPLSAQLRLLQVRQHLHDVAEQLRCVSHTLHPGIVEDLGIVDAITFTSRVFTRRTKIPMVMSVKMDPPCSPAAGALVYRFVHEALANIGQHARATSAAIALERAGSDIVCIISDDGLGFDVTATLAPDATRHLGLRLIQARIEAAGGALDIVSVAGQGTRLRAVVPAEI